MNLREMYGITKTEENLCSLIRFIRGTNKIPQLIIKQSYKKYGRKDCLGRYYYHKYSGASVGKYTYGYQFLNNDNIDSIGAFCSIAPGQTIVPNNHKIDYITTSPILQLKEFGFLCDDKIINNKQRNIKIGNDVWIGTNCIIFEGINIGDGAVIAAGSIIRKDVPPYAVVGGVDKILRYRFSDIIIEKLLLSQWWKWNDESIRKNIAFMYNINDFIKILGDVYNVNDSNTNL